MKHVAVLMVYKILFIYTHTYIYIYVCVCVCVCVCCALVGMDNKLYKMHSTYIKVVVYTLLMEVTYIYTSLVENVKCHSLCT